MAVIYRIMVQCPETGKAIDSGMRTSGREALNSGLLQAGTLGCPYCRKMHSFQGDGYLDVDARNSADALWRPNS
jgi:hypothetical protein